MMMVRRCPDLWEQAILALANILAAALQVVGGGALVFLAGLVIGNA
ncbi:MAG: hypothetical protein ACHQ7N_18945 [Candidatus Methylomirabilales bacterium]